MTDSLAAAAMRDELNHLRRTIAALSHTNAVIVGAIDAVLCGARTLDELRAWRDGPRLTPFYSWRDERAELFAKLSSTAWTLAYPREMSPAVKRVLSQPCFKFILLAELWRQTGTPIARAAEEEQAHFLDLQLRLVLQHGDEWEAEFAKLVGERVDHARAGTKVAS